MPGDSVLIYIENQRHDLPSDEVMAADLRQLGNIPADNKVFRETPGDEPDPEVPASGAFKVHEGEKFYAVPPGVFGSVLVEDECAALTSRHGGEIRRTPDGQRYLVLEHYPLGPGWNPPAAPLAVRITGYPEALLDGFFVPSYVRLATGAQPTSASLIPLFGTDLWWTFSYHPQGWRPGRHTLQSFLGFVQQRFAEVR